MEWYRIWVMNWPLNAFGDPLLKEGCEHKNYRTVWERIPGEDRYRKKDGQAVGGGYFEECKLAGEVADETQKMIVFKHTNEVSDKIQIIGAKLTRFKPGYPNIIEIYEILKQVKPLLENDNKY